MIFGIDVLMNGEIGIKKQHFVLGYAFVYARVYVYVYRVSVMTRVILGTLDWALQVPFSVTVIAGSTIDLARRDVDFLKSVCIEVDGRS